MEFRKSGQVAIADFHPLQGIKVDVQAGSYPQHLPILLSAYPDILSIASHSCLMALPSIRVPVSPRKVAVNIANKMGFVRQGLMARGEYLADPAILERVDWEHYGRGQRLVLLPRPPVSPDSRLPTPFPDGPDSRSCEKLPTAVVSTAPFTGTKFGHRLVLPGSDIQWWARLRWALEFFLQFFWVSVSSGNEHGSSLIGILFKIL